MLRAARSAGVFAFYFLLILIFPAFHIKALAQAQTPLFPQATPLIGPDNFPVFTGDLNGDGVNDLAAVNEGNLLEVILSVGKSNSTTVNTQINCPASSPARVVFGDLNKDKKPDLVASCNGYVIVQLGNGDGTFQNPAYSAVNALAPVLVDLNGDGYLDVAVTVVVNATTRIAVLLNQGAASAGTLAAPVYYNVPAGSLGLLAGDFNGDGKQDLLTGPTSGVGNPASTTVTLLTGNGDGTLNAAATQTIATYLSWTAADFNGDGITDLALLNAPANSTDLYSAVQILLGSTSGTFQTGPTAPMIATPAGDVGPYQPMEATDLTGDGKLDLVIATNVANIYVGDGKGGFSPTGTYAVAGGPNAPVSPYLFADLNGTGKPGMLVSNSYGTYFFPGNGDGTFQATPGTTLTGPIADFNGDGIADMAFVPPQGGTYFGTALGRGDGTFSVLDQTTPLLSNAASYVLMTGDFNNDGKIDTIAIQPGSLGSDPCFEPANAQLLSYLGTGDGRFKSAGSAVQLGVRLAAMGVTGDFNGDGNLDLIIPYGYNLCGLGNLFVPGHGDGTFGTPVQIPATGQNQYTGLVAGDLNNDKRPDFIWGQDVFLSNGDGTFKQIPLTVPTNASANQPIAVALADLNGDGILDMVASPGTTIYAGIGDGTFATTPFYTVTLPQYTYAQSVAVADVNGDGHPDLLVVAQNNVSALIVYLGDGSGGFTQDPNSYFVSTAVSSLFTPIPIVAARLNNQAPPAASDNKPDLLITLSNGATSPYTASLLNLSNPAPAKPAAISSSTTLTASPTTAAPNATVTLTASVFGESPTGTVTFAANGKSLGTGTVTDGSATLQTSFASAGSYSVTAAYSGDGNNSASNAAAVTVTVGMASSSTTLAAPGTGSVNGKITLTATVSGDSPTGTVTFSAGSTNLGSASLVSGVATLQTSFSAAGSYSVTAAYQGDANNSSSTSSAVTIVIASPDFSITASPANGTVTAGQTATFTFTVTPAGGYGGTVSFACGSLPSEATCSFAPTSVTPADGKAASTTLTVTTMGAQASKSVMARGTPRPGRPWLPASGLATAAVLGLAFSSRATRRWRKSLYLILPLAAIAFSLSGCGGGGNSGGGGGSQNPGTPSGTYTISVNATGSASGPQHAASISLKVQ